jgi:hypothetical protein
MLESPDAVSAIAELILSLTEPVFGLEMELYEGSHVAEVRRIKLYKVDIRRCRKKLHRIYFSAPGT